MHVERRLFSFTSGVRGRIAWAVLIGLAAVAAGVTRLALLGWLIAEIFAGKDLQALLWPIAAIAGVMILRGALEHARTMVAHETAARVQRRLRRAIFDRIAALGPAAVARRRSGALTLSLVDGVEQLEVYFGQFLPQFLIALLTPPLIFIAVAFVDLPVALVMLGFALLALFAPGLWHKKDTQARSTASAPMPPSLPETSRFDPGPGDPEGVRPERRAADRLAERARELFRRTMWVLATNSAARGITDTAIACGAAAAMALGAARVESGALSMAGLLVILMLGIEVYRPMRELRSVLHQGMVGMSAAQGIYAILDDEPSVADARPAALTEPLTPSIAFEDGGLPLSRQPAHRAQRG